jgi:hypothetical protein
VLAVLATACGRGEAVRTPMQATEIAQKTLRSAGLDKEVVAAERQDGSWLVTTRWRETPRAGHLVTVQAATGKVTVERYRTLELAGPRPAG